MSKKAAVAGQSAPAPSPASAPLRGSLYAQLLCSDEKRLKLRCSQKVWLWPATAFKLFAQFTDNEVPRVRTQIKHKIFLAALPALRVSGRFRQEENKVKATLYLKNRIALWPKTNLNIKVELHARSSFENSKPKDVNKSVEGRIELSQKILNLTDSQDCRLRVGVDLRTLSVYAEARENHLSLKIERERLGNVSYAVLYDL